MGHSYKNLYCTSTVYFVFLCLIPNVDGILDTFWVHGMYFTHNLSHTHTHTHTDNAGVGVCVCVQIMYICTMYVCMYICMYVCMYVCMY